MPVYIFFFEGQARETNRAACGQRLIVEGWRRNAFSLFGFVYLLLDDYRELLRTAKNSLLFTFNLQARGLGNKVDISASSFASKLAPAGWRRRLPLGPLQGSRPMPRSTTAVMVCTACSNCSSLNG
ncbi:hypothetical protein [Pseudomonas japonica]|uniref:Uncharacterized protein n=1 Tax=Pseudomonas japonica TaxID=256466 RepID=A0A239IQN8_9PSED|nr:hypothetical protein [Pseudomonas japonica]SNS95528.1 hypothetical protein SAMN05444352_119101 [Pseudomonas japonica]